MRSLSRAELEHYFVEPYHKGAELICTSKPTLMLPCDSSPIFRCIDSTYYLLVGTQKVAGLLLVIPLINTVVQLVFDKIGVELSRFYNDAWYIQHNFYIRTTLRSSELSDDNIDCLLSALKKSNRIRYLDLSNNKIGDCGAKKIADLLKIHPTLEWLNLSNNCIGDEGIEGIADSLKTNSMLLFINLAGNTFGDAGVQKMGEGLASNTTLKTICLQSEKTTDKIGRSLFTLIRDSNKLLQLIYYSKQSTGKVGKLSKQDGGKFTELEKTAFDDWLTELTEKTLKNVYC